MAHMVDAPKAQACFISYRHTRNEDAQRYVQTFVRQLRKSLSFEIPNVPIFFDESGIKVGTEFHDELALQLCRSACLVIFFSPQHFDSEHIYCALEYQAMVELEKQRRRLYGKEIGNMSLILPVVFRGREHLPKELEARTPLDFTDIIVESDFEEKAAQEQIMGLAREIARRYRVLSKAGAFEGRGTCSNFRFPDSEAIKPWIESVEPGSTVWAGDFSWPQASEPESEHEQNRICEKAIESVRSNEMEAASSQAFELLGPIGTDLVNERILTTILLVADSMLPTLPSEGLELMAKTAERAASTPSETGASFARIAAVFRRNRSFEEALEYERRALDRYVQSFGSLHVVTLETRERVANDLMVLGNTAGALEMRELLVERRRDLANDLVTEGDVIRAREQLQLAFDVCREGLGPRARLATHVTSELARMAPSSQ